MSEAKFFLDVRDQARAEQRERDGWTFLCVGAVELIDFGDRDAGTNPS